MNDVTYVALIFSKISSEIFAGFPLRQKKWIVSYFELKLRYEPDWKLIRYLSEAKQSFSLSANGVMQIDSNIIVKM